MFGKRKNKLVFTKALTDQLVTDSKFMIHELKQGQYHEKVVSGMIHAMYSGKALQKMKKLQTKVAEELK